LKEKVIRTRAVNPEYQESLPEGETWKSLEEFTLAEMRRGRGDEDQLIPRLCERTGWDWEQSRLFLLSVENQNSIRIKLDRSRLYLITAFILGIVGAGFIVLAYEFQRGSGNLAPCLSFEFTQAWQQIVGVREFKPCLAWNSTWFVDPLLLALIGIMMVTGSIYGALQAIQGRE
jgi:hypothetical protein